jgi:endothelin-converting enzyme
MKANFAKNYTAIDPCVDIDLYACEGWRDTHDFKPDQNGKSKLSFTVFVATIVALPSETCIRTNGRSETGTSTLMAENNENLMKSILEGPYDEKTTASLTAEQKVLDKANFNKLKSAYKSCMNEDAIKKAGVTPLKKLLDEFEKQFPAEGSKQAGNKEELTKVLIWLAEHKFSDLVSVTMQVCIARPFPVSCLTDLTRRTPKIPQSLVFTYLARTMRIYPRKTTRKRLRLQSTRELLLK